MKRDALLNNKKDKTEFELDEYEKQELHAVLTLVSQAQMAHDLLITRVANNVADHHQINHARIDLNMEEVMKHGVERAKLIVKYEIK